MARKVKHAKGSKQLDIFKDTPVQRDPTPVRSSSTGAVIIDISRYRANQRDDLRAKVLAKHRREK